MTIGDSGLRCKFWARTVITAMLFSRTPTLPAMAPKHSQPGIVEVVDHIGQHAEAPTLLLEVPHGATRARHYDTLRDALRGDYPDDLRDFFFVNTDVGAPEWAGRIAEQYVDASPEHWAIVVSSEIPRTFVDCNRVIDSSAAMDPSGAVTPGLHVYVTDPADRALLLAKHQAYVDTVEGIYADVMAADGLALMLHTYAPRSLDVPVDERIVERLRAEYQPERIETWPLRAEIDLIADDPDGRRLASTALVDHVSAALRTIGREVAISGTYSLHAGTLAAELARQYEGRTLCAEARRDLLVQEFTPFAEMLGDAAKIEPLARAVTEGVLAARRLQSGA